MAQGLTQPLTEMSTRNVSCDHLHVPIVLKSGSLKLLESSGPVQAMGLLTFMYVVIVIVLQVKYSHSHG